MRKFIKANKFLIDGKLSGPGFLEIIQNKFGNFYKKKPSSEIEVLDFSDYIISPGLVDTHIHGIFGHEIMDGSIEGLMKISEVLPKSGVTSFLPTTLTAPIGEINQAVTMIGKNHTKVKGAKVQGIYLEGPFFTEKYKGAQNEKYFLDPCINLLEDWINLSGNMIKKIALAPERDGAVDFIKYATSHNIVVALGHSDATFLQVKEAIEAGASVFVHTFNGMRPLNHREPGMVGAALSLDGTFAELICDGHHIHPYVAKILIKARGTQSVSLITDCMRAALMPDATYNLGELSVTVTEGIARLKTGNLAGSTLLLKDAIRNMIVWGLVSVEEALLMATKVPAVSSNIQDRCGFIEEGREADFIVLNSDIELIHTFIDGKCVFTKT